MLRSNFYIMLLLTQFSQITFGESLEEYAAKCKTAMDGVEIPSFDCKDGIEIDVTGHSQPNTYGGQCDKPSQLTQRCDPGARFFRFNTGKENIVIVGLCRYKGAPVGGDTYRDIAIIAHNSNDGSTCFFQALEELPNEVPAPKNGEQNFWLSPNDTASHVCVGCHDNGPFIRSPYITQINSMPGKGDNNFNKNSKYKFMGDDFTDWKAYPVTVEGNICTNCHRMAVNNQSPQGTARTFGLRATRDFIDAKNPHSANSPVWMPSGSSEPNPSWGDAAQAIKDCGDNFDESNIPYNSGGCHIGDAYTELESNNPTPPENTASYDEGEQIISIYLEIMKRRPVGNEFSDALNLIHTNGRDENSYDLLREKVKKKRTRRILRILW